MNQLALAAVFVLVAQTFFLLFWMGFARVSAVRSRAVRVRDIALGQSAWPARVTQINRAFQNQLELPLVFYALVALVIATGVATPLFIGLCWLFVALRIAHAAVHVTSNFLLLRFGLFATGAIALLVAWIWFLARTYFLT